MRTENDIKKIMENSLKMINIDTIKIINTHTYDKHFATENSLIRKVIKKKDYFVWFFTESATDTERSALLDRLMNCMANDEIFTEYISRQIYRESFSKEGPIFDIRDFEGPDAKPVGYYTRNGKIKETYCFLFAVELKGSDYTDSVFMTPFAICSLYPVPEDQY